MRELCLLLLLAASAAAQKYSVEAFGGTDFNGDGGPATAAVLHNVLGMATDGAGNVYIADTDDHLVRKIGPDGLIHTIAGTGRPGFSGDGGPANAAELNAPYGLARDGAGNLYVADLGNRRIRRISAEGTITTVAGGGANPAAEGMAALSAALTSPRNVAVDGAGNIYLSDFGGHRVWQVTTGGILAAVAGTGTAGYSGDKDLAVLAEINSPAGLALDPWGAVYIADSGNGKVRRVYRSQITTAPADLRCPTGLAFDADQNLYVADPCGNQTVRIPAQGAAAPMPNVAHEVAGDAEGNLFFAEGAYVLRLSPAAGTTIIAGSYPVSPLGKPVGEVRLTNPRGLAGDEKGTVYIADTANHRVLQVGPDGVVTSVIGSGVRGYAGDGSKAGQARLNSPASVAVSGGALYIADTGNHTIRKVADGIITTVAGTGEAGYSGDGDHAVFAKLRSPSGLAFDTEGNLLICDTGNHRVRRLLKSGFMDTLAGTGQPDYTGDHGYPAASALNAPRAVAVDSKGIVYIADAGNHRIRRLRFNDVPRPTIESVPEGPIWRDPEGLAVASDAALVVADAADQRVFRVEESGRIATIAGSGVSGYSGDGGPALNSQWNGPAAVSTGSSGIFYVADSGNNRIRRLTSTDPNGPTTDTPGQMRVVNAASFAEGPVAPGEIVTLWAPGVFAGATGIRVSVNGRTAPVFAVTADQVNAQIPPSIGEEGSAAIQVEAQGRTMAAANVPLAPSAPGIFQAASGQAAALNQDLSYNSRENPAPRGSIIVLYATGEGLTNPPLGDGVAAPWPAPLTRLPVSVRIGGYDARIDYAGAAPGYLGLMQINAEVPGGFAPAGCIAVEVHVGSTVSQAGVSVCTR